MTYRLRSNLRVLLAASLTVLLMAGIASAYWYSGSTAGGSGAAAATSVNQGATPTASAVGGAVTVGWAARTLASGQAVAGYQIKRYRASDLALQTTLSNCTGTVAALTCTENAVPTGSWKYTTTPVSGTNWLGAESAKSTTVTVDSTAPTNAITLSAVTGNAAMVGNTVYYRGTVAGSFTLTNTVTDADSGPASSATAALTGTATGWTHSPTTVSTPTGGPYVSSVFSWGASTTTSPGEVVTGSDVAGNTATTALSFVNDSTAPTGGTVTYTDGYQPGMSVPVTFTAGTDTGGSGIGTGRLQRQSAPLTTADTCVTWSGYTNIGVVNPTSVYTDFAVANGTCYMYQYVVTDVAGNTSTVVGTSVSRVDYAGAVTGTSGALSQWRLGEPSTTLSSTDSFTEQFNGGLLTAHTGEIGATWAYQAGSGNTEKTDAVRTWRNGTGYTVTRTTATPATPDYSVEADLWVNDNNLFATNDVVGVFGRLITGSTSFYMARWDTNTWKIVKWSGVTPTVLSTTGVQPNLTVGMTYRLKLQMSGSSTTTLKLYVNNVLLLTTTDASSPFTAAGNAGIMDGDPSVTTFSKTSTVGMQYDNFQVTPSTYPRTADSKGTSTGDYQNGVVLGAADAVTGDADTAAQFDGVNDDVDTPPRSLTDFSVEFWFNSTQGLGTGGDVYSGAALVNASGYFSSVNDWGIALRSDGKVVTGVGNPEVSIISATGSYNNGAWHQVVFTRNSTTGAMVLYIDGSSANGNTGTGTGALNSGADVTFGQNYGDKSHRYAGQLDEVSLYSTVLSQTTVTNHYQLGTSTTDADVTGPTGGSVDASGLVGTGSRYAPSTTLSLTLAKGSDPSGVATTGATLQRATATLTSAGVANGACGGFGSYSLVATDPASPASDTVTDQACYRYQYVAFDTLGNSTTYTSPDIKVDRTASSAPVLTFGTFTNTYWTTGGTVYYRSAAASGSFIATSTASDTASGIASHTFPALGTNWTSTPGALGVNTYSWAGTPAAPGTQSVTATNNAAVVSASTSFTPTADDTAPSGDTVTYGDAIQSGTTASVAFTTGTDGGSGVGTRLLQRASTTLTGTTCGGTYGSFATITGGTNPASSPVVDTVAVGNCYKYQYVVSDQVGNLHTATSSSVVSVQTYVASVQATTGLSAYWRLGEASATLTASDSFTGTAGTLLTATARTPEIGATWQFRAASACGSSTDTERISSGTQARARRSGTGCTIDYTTAPASADYSVEADLYVKSFDTLDVVGVVGRMTLGGGSNTSFYMARWAADNSWKIVKVASNGTPTTLWTSGTGLADLASDRIYRLKLEMSGSSTTTLKLYVDNVLLSPPTTDSSSPFTGAGNAGIMDGDNGNTVNKSDTVGIHYDNFQVTPSTYPRAADSKGTNTGDYQNGVTLGTASALTGDANTAAQFDGVNDDVQAVGTTNIPVGASVRSVEMWFKTTSTARQTLFDYGTSANDQQYGLTLVASSQTVMAWGYGGGDKTFTFPSSVTNGVWHQIVQTYDGTTMTIYIDGVPLTPQAATRNTVMSATGFAIGANITNASEYFNGSIDEVSVYAAVLDQPTATNHYRLGTGVAAGS